MHMMTTQIIAVLTLEFICSSILETSQCLQSIHKSTINASTVYLIIPIFFASRSILEHFANRAEHDNPWQLQTFQPKGFDPQDI